MNRFDPRRVARTITLMAVAAAALWTPQLAAGGSPPPASGDQSTLLGVFHGDVQGSASLCPDPADNESFSPAILITLDSVSSNHAVGGFVTSDGDVGTLRLQINALNSVVGQGSGKSLDGSTFSLSFSGSFNPGTGRLSLGFGGSDDLGCSLSGSILVTKVFLSFAFDPANAPPSVILNQEGARQGANQGQRISGIAGQRLQRGGGGGEGVMRFGNGAMIEGQAAGSGMPIGAWAGVSRTSTEDDFATTAFKETRYDFLGGLDTLLEDGNTLVGVALGIQTGDTTTQFNGGSQNLTAITVAPYVAMLLTDWLSFDASVGYSDVQIDQSRTSAAGTLITSDVEGMRLFASVNLAATYRMDNLLLTGLGGMSWAKQRNDPFVESGGLRVGKQSSNIGRFLFGGEAAYTAGAWEPYARALFEYDFTKTRVAFAPGVAAPRNDDSDVLVGLGVRYFGDNGVSGALEYSTLLGRRNLDEDTLSANMRWEF